MNRRTQIALSIFLFSVSVRVACATPNVLLKPADTKSGFIAQLLTNEVPFPGEHGWVGEENTKSAMLQILWVCHGRIHHVPSGYDRKEVAVTTSGDIIDVITVGGEKGQCDGFYRDAHGHFKAVPRVQKRIDYLLKIANEGTPGRFARLLLHAQGLADAYVAEGIRGADRYAGLDQVHKVSVTGRAYSWMADKDCYNPGGSFVKIPNAHEGSLGGNRFFTLKERNP